MRTLPDSPKRLLLTLLLPLAAAILTACGSSNSSSQLSPAQYRQRASSICSTGNARLAKVQMPTSDAQIVPYLEQALAIEKPLFAKLKALAPPSSLAPGASRALADVERAIVAVEGVVSAVRRGGSASAVLASREGEITRLNNETHAAWTSIGVPACARS